MEVYTVMGHLLEGLDLEVDRPRVVMATMVLLGTTDH